MSMNRKHALALAVALVSLASTAHAADKLRLERLDVHVSPTVKYYLSYVDGDGRVVTGRAKEDFKIVIDSAEQGVATAVQSFDETKEPINIVVVALVGTNFNSVIEDIKRGIGAIADALPPKSKMGVLGYAADNKRATDGLATAVEAESAGKTLTIDSEAAESHMLNAVRSGLDWLKAAGPNERKLMIVVSDGIDSSETEARVFNTVGKRAQEDGIVIDTIGFNEYDASKLRNLEALAKQSSGMARLCKTAGDVGNHFTNIVDEIKKQYVATFEISLAGGDGKDHDFSAVASNNGREVYSGIVKSKIPKPVHPVKAKGGEGGSRWWLWVLLGVVGIGLIGLIAWLIFREKGEEEMPAEAPAPVPAPVTAAPAAPMKTMALNVDVRGGTPAVGWLVGTTGKYADQTFKLKPSRTVIGTGADCDVRVEDQFMSSKHCEVRFEGGSFKLFDLGSTNGIVVNDKKVREHELVDNDLFRLGRTEFKFKSIT
jgi:FHA domain